jgi:AcrR family transcriptional regulator
MLRGRPAAPAPVRFTRTSYEQTGLRDIAADVGIDVAYVHRCFGSKKRLFAKAGNARVRRSMIELAWGHLLHQKDSPLAKWYRRRTADARGGTRKTMIVALARKLLITLWRLVTTGEAPAGLLLRPAA